LPAVALWRGRSAAMFARQDKAGWAVRIELGDSSWVCPSSVAAFCHCREKPATGLIGTSKIWSFVSLREYEYSSEKRERRSMLTPSSISPERAGLRFVFSSTYFFGFPPTI